MHESEEEAFMANKGAIKIDYISTFLIYFAGVLVGLSPYRYRLHCIHGHIHQVLCGPHSLVQPEETSSQTLLRDAASSHEYFEENGEASAVSQQNLFLKKKNRVLHYYILRNFV